MRRRDVIAMLGGAAVAWPAVARAQQGALRRLAFLAAGVANLYPTTDIAVAFLQALGDLGWKEGVNLRIDWRWFGADAALAAKQAAELLALKPDLFLAGGNIAVEPIRRLSKTIPIVFALTSDPVGMGYVESLAHPGHHTSGFSSYDPPIYTKQLQMLTEIKPRPSIVAVLYNPQSAPYAGRMLRAMEDGARSLGVTLRDAPCHDDAEIEVLMASLGRDAPSALLALGDVFNQVHRDTIIASSLKYRIPTLANTREQTEGGGLMSYAVDITDLYRRAAPYVDRVLKGVDPGDLAVQRPVKFETAVNLKTAKALGITVAPALLATADEVIE